MLDSIKKNPKTFDFSIKTTNFVSEIKTIIQYKPLFLKQMKRLLLFLITCLTISAANAQMAFHFASVNTTTKQLANGTTLLEFPVGTDLATVMKSGLTVTVDGATASTTDIVPNPSTLSLNDDEQVVFLYQGKAYQFRFSEGKYFTAVFFSDPHTAQDGHDGTSVSDMQAYIARIINMGNADGPRFAFDALPGYVPTCDIAFSLGDMDQDSEKTGENFKNAHQGFNNAGIPFITMCGNHDLVPDYWTGDNPDKGLTYGFNDGGAYCNDIALQLVADQYAEAQKHGIGTVEVISDDSKRTQANPFTFTFNGVRFYCGQTYWFQKPYSKPTLFGSATYYAPDGVVSTLKQFVANHKDEPSVWMQHYPFVAGSDCDRWWLDQNDVGKYIKTTDHSDYGTDQDLGAYNSDATAQSYAKKKKDDLAYIIQQTKNAVHFSGHVHSYAENTYNGLTDYTVAATGRNDGGLAGGYIVLMKGNKGVVEVKRIHVSETNNSTLDDCETTEFKANATGHANAVAVRMATALASINDNGIATATAQLATATTEEAVDEATTAMNNAFSNYFDNNGGESVDVTALLGANTNFETAQGNAIATNQNVHPQTGWNEHLASFTNATNAQYIHLRQRTDDGAATATSIYLRAKWQAYACTDQILKQTALPTGSYTLKFRIKKAGTYTQNLNYYEVNGKRTEIPASTSWAEQTIALSINEPSLVTLSFGFTGGVGGTESAVSVDDLTLLCTGTISPYKKALQAAKALDTDVAHSAVDQYEWTDDELATKTTDEVETAIAVLNNAVAISQAQNDATLLIANADFTGGYTGNASGSRVQTPTGWQFDYQYEGWNDTFVDANQKLFNAWAGTIKRAELMQTLANLPNGAYRFSADVKTDDGDNAATSTIALYGNCGWPVIGRSDEVGGNAFTRYSCAFDVADNSVTIGIRSDKQYYQIKNLKLEYIGLTAEAETDASYLRQDYFWNGRDKLEFDASGDKYAYAKDVVVYPTQANQLITAAAADQFRNTDNKIVEGVCQNLVISDGNPFSTTKAFTASNATFSRTFAANQMSTVCLPFVPDNVDGTLYKLTSDNGTMLHFDDVTAPEANVPYIYVPDKDATLTATNANVPATPSEMKTTPTTSGFFMQGVYETTSVENIYGLSTSGTLLKATNATMNPFRAFIQSPEDVASAKPMTAEFGTATGITSPLQTATDEKLYDLQGRRVNDATAAKHGIYISNGKKIWTKH